MEACGATWTHVVSEASLICKLWELCKSVNPLSHGFHVCDMGKTLPISQCVCENWVVK